MIGIQTAFLIEFLVTSVQKVKKGHVDNVGAWFDLSKQNPAAKVSTWNWLSCDDFFCWLWTITIHICTFGWCVHHHKKPPNMKERREQKLEPGAKLLLPFFKAKRWNSELLRSSTAACTAAAISLLLLCWTNDGGMAAGEKLDYVDTC